VITDGFMENFEALWVFDYREVDGKFEAVWVFDYKLVTAQRKRLQFHVLRLSMCVNLR